MLKDNQKIALRVAAAATITITGTAVAVLKRSFELENKAIALGQVLMEHNDVLSETDRKHLTMAGINWPEA